MLCHAECACARRTTLWWPGQRLSTVRVDSAVLSCGFRAADGFHGILDSLPWPMQLACLGAFAGIAGLAPLRVAIAALHVQLGTAASWPVGCRVWLAQLAAAPLGSCCL